MSAPRRYLLPQIRSDLRAKMVFVAGPRQVGKTTLAKRLPGADAGYLNWDDAPPDRSLRYLKARFPGAHAWQLSAVGTKDYQTPEGIRVSPALQLLGSLI